MGDTLFQPNPPLNPTAASGSLGLAALRYAAFDAARRILCDGRYGQKPALAVTAD